MTNEELRKLMLAKGSDPKEIDNILSLLEPIDNKAENPAMRTLLKTALNSMVTNVNLTGPVELPPEEQYVMAPRRDIEDIARERLHLEKPKIVTPEGIARTLDGVEYGKEVSDQLRKILIDHNLVIVHGYSDDLIEFDGAIIGEFGAGQEVCIINKKILVNDCDDEDCPYFKKLKAQSKYRLFGDLTDSGWEIETTIPNVAKFTVVDGAEHYGIGIVFSLDDLVD